MSQGFACELGDSMARMEEELDLCFASDKEDLARVLIKRKLEAERYANRISCPETTSATV